MDLHKGSGEEIGEGSTSNVKVIKGSSPRKGQNILLWKQQN